MGTDGDGGQVKVDGGRWTMETMDELAVDGGGGC